MPDMAIGFLAGCIPTSILFLMYVLHLKSIANDVLNDEKARLQEESERYIEARARERVVDILTNVSVKMPVTLINESDIYWGEQDDMKGERA